MLIIITLVVVATAQMPPMMDFFTGPYGEMMMKYYSQLQSNYEEEFVKYEAWAKLEEEKMKSTLKTESDAVQEYISKLQGDISSNAPKYEEANQKMVDDYIKNIELKDLKAERQAYKDYWTAQKQDWEHQFIPPKGEMGSQDLVPQPMDKEPTEQDEGEGGEEAPPEEEQPPEDEEQPPEEELPPPDDADCDEQFGNPFTGQKPGESAPPSTGGEGGGDSAGQPSGGQSGGSSPQGGGQPGKQGPDAQQRFQQAGDAMKGAAEVADGVKGVADMLPDKYKKYGKVAEGASKLLNSGGDISHSGAKVAEAAKNPTVDGVVDATQGVAKAVSGGADAVKTVAGFLPGKWGKIAGTVAKGADKVGKAADIVDKGSGFAKGFFSPKLDELDHSVRRFYQEPENLFERNPIRWENTNLIKIEPSDKPTITRQQLEEHKQTISYLQEKVNDTSDGIFKTEQTFEEVDYEPMARMPLTLEQQVMQKTAESNSIAIVAARQELEKKVEQLKRHSPLQKMIEQHYGVPQKQAEPNEQKQQMTLEQAMSIVDRDYLNTAI